MIDQPLFSDDRQSNRSPHGWHNFMCMHNKKAATMGSFEMLITL